MGGIERVEHETTLDSAEVDTSAAPAAPDLVVGSAFDPAEREAEQVAEKVLARIADAGGEHVHVGATAGAPAVRRETSDAASAEGGAVAAPLAAQIQGAQGGGTPLPAGLRRTLEGAMSADLGAVRVHTDSAAASSSAAIGARAYTTGQNIFFGSGQFAPDTEDGLRTIAHEVAHTLQNAGSGGGSVQRRIAGALDEAKSLGGDATVVVKQRAPKAKKAKTTEAAAGSTPEVADEKATDEIASSDETVSAETVSSETAADEKDADRKAVDETASAETSSDEKDADQKAVGDTESAETASRAEEKDGRADAAGSVPESPESASDETASDEKDGAASAPRAKLSAWDRIINGLSVYERHETLLEGKKVDAYLSVRGTLMGDRDRVEQSVQLWREETKDQSVPDDRQKAVEALSERLAAEEKLIEDGDQTEWLESFGFGTDDEAYGDDSEDSDLIAGIARHDGDDIPAEFATVSDENDKIDDVPAAGVRVGTTTQDDAAERIEEKVSDEVVAPASAELGPDGLSESVVGSALQEVKDVDTGTPGQDRDELQRALTKLQVIDAIVGRVGSDQTSDEKSDGTSGTGSDLPAIIGAQLAAAVLRIKADDVKDALDGLLPEREIEATVERLESVQAEIKDAGGAAGPDTELAAAVVAAGVGGSATEAKDDYLREMGVSSPEELKQDVDTVVVRLFEGFGGSSLRPGLGKDIEDLPEPVLEGLLEAMALAGGPNDIITAYILDNRLADDLVQDVVEAAVSAYLDKRIFENFRRWAGETTMPIVTLASTTLNAGFDRRFADDVVGVGLS